MARASVRAEGGSEDAPETLHLENDRLAVTLRRAGGSYELASVRVGGREMLHAPSPVLSRYDGKEHAPIPFQRVAIEESAEGARLRLFARCDFLALDAEFALAPGRPLLECDCRFQVSEEWHGLVYFSCIALPGFQPAAYPWIAGESLLDAGFAHANCLGAPLLAGDPRAGHGFLLALGFPLAEEYRDLFFHYDPETRRISAGLGEGCSRPPGAQAANDSSCPAPDPARRSWLRLSLRRRKPLEAPEPPPALSLRIPHRAGESYRIPLHLWALKGDLRSLAGEWMSANDFSFDLPALRSPAEALRMTLRFLERGAPFLAGKGYPRRACRYIYSPGKEDGGWVSLYGNAALACALYRCWVRFREDWMRERALALVGAILSRQRRDGFIPEALDPRTDKPITLGAGTHYDGLGLCLDSLLRLYQEQKAAEQHDDVSLRDAVAACGRALLDVRRQRLEREQRAGKRRHDEEAGFPCSSTDARDAPNVNLLVALERLRRITGERRFEIVREEMEKWVLHHAYYPMRWWGGDPVHPGPETGSALRFIEYALLRYGATQGTRYLEMAEHLASHYFLSLVPRDLPWCAGHTKGLAIRNAEWRALVAPFAGGVSPTEALHRLSQASGDRFYAQLGDYLACAALAAQCDEKGVPGCGGWLPAVNSPDANAFVLNGAPFDGEVCVTDLVPTALETYLYLTRQEADLGRK